MNVRYAGAGYRKVNRKRRYTPAASHSAQGVYGNRVSSSGVLGSACQSGHTAPGVRSGLFSIKNPRLRRGIEDFSLISLRIRENKSPAPQVLTAPRGEVLNPKTINLRAFVGYLKGRWSISFSALKNFFQEVLGIGVRRGLLAKQVRKGSYKEPRADGRRKERSGG